MKHIPVILLFLLFVGGCASNVPIEIREPLPYGPSVAAVQEDIKPYVGKYVRWGGVIVSVDNRPNDTWVEIVAKELGNYGRPVDSDVSLGRFLVRVDGFLDPAVYRADREITVYGVMENQLTRKIGERIYTYPLIKAEKEKLYLWPGFRSYGYSYPYWHDPYWYSPYYPYYSPFRHRFLRHRPSC
jgi:outer membrane lipoprotein